MRTTAFLLGSLVLLLTLGSALRAGENESDGMWADLTPTARAALEKYRQETLKRLMELDTIIGLPPDKPHDGETIYGDICEEDAQELATAYEIAREAEMSRGGDAQDTLDWLEKQHEFVHKQWSWLAGEGSIAYYRNCEMRQRVLECAKAKEYVDAFSDWYANFARPLDDAVAAGRRALKSAGRTERESALAACQQQLHVAKLLDSVYEKYEEKFQEIIELFEEDEFSDVGSWYNDWPIEATEDEVPELFEHRRKWEEAVDWNYEAVKVAEEEAVELMKPVLEGTFMRRHSFKEIGDWIAEGGLTERMEWLVADLQKALR